MIWLTEIPGSEAKGSLTNLCQINKSSIHHRDTALTRSYDPDGAAGVIIHEDKCFIYAARGEVYKAMRYRHVPYHIQNRAGFFRTG
ncbi:hypothetical protein D3C80_1739300 [compost metagenome]